MGDPAIVLKAILHAGWRARLGPETEAARRAVILERNPTTWFTLRMNDDGLPVLTGAARTALLESLTAVGCAP